MEEIIEHPKNYFYGGFWLRFWAYLLDILIVASINGIILTPLFMIAELGSVKIGVFSLETILVTIVTLLYFLLLTKKFGQTIGKRVFGLKVINKNNEPLTWSALIFREVIGRYILQAFFLCFTLYLIVAFHKNKQGLHDMIGDTYVVRNDLL